MKKQNVTVEVETEVRFLFNMSIIVVHVISASPATRLTHRLSAAVRPADIVNFDKLASEQG